MPTPLRPWTKAMLARLADNEWHTLDELLSVALPTIPQQRAIRHAESERARKRGSEHGSPAHQSDTVMRGARDIARVTLRGLTHTGRLEHTDNRYRLTPETTR